MPTGEVLRGWGDPFTRSNKVARELSVQDMLVPKAIPNWWGQIGRPTWAYLHNSLIEILERTMCNNR